MIEAETFDILEFLLGLALGLWLGWGGKRKSRGGAWRGPKDPKPMQPGQMIHPRPEHGKKTTT